jgi:hypothetical protein
MPGLTNVGWAFEDRGPEAGRRSVCVGRFRRRRIRRVSDRPRLKGTRSSDRRAAPENARSSKTLASTVSSTSPASRAAIAGRHTGYTVRQLHFFQDGSRSGPAEAVMHNVVLRLTTNGMLAIVTSSASRGSKRGSTFILKMLAASTLRPRLPQRTRSPARHSRSFALTKFLREIAREHLDRTL